MDKFIIKDNNLIDLRLDKALNILANFSSRNKIQEAIKSGLVLVNGRIEKSSYKLVLNDEIIIKDIPLKNITLEAEDIPLNVIYEDDDLLVINKPKGLVVHPGAGVNNHTLANALKFYSDELSSLNGEFRPGIVHRLDKDTAGLLVVAKNDASHTYLASQLSNHSLGRNYIALVKGIINENDGTIIAPIARSKKNRLKMAVDVANGKEAVTHYKVLERFKNYTLVECKLETGRTHQIRVHMEYISHPVIGDPLYGNNNKDIYSNGQLLFAYKISFIHPKSKKRMEFSVPLPDYFLDVINSLK